MIQHDVPLLQKNTRNYTNKILVGLEILADKNASLSAAPRVAVVIITPRVRRGRITD